MPDARLTDDSAIWIIVPAYNEAARIGKTLAPLCRAFPNIVVIDDGSSDDTAAIAAKSPVWLLQHMINSGQGAALQTGIDFALKHGAGIIVTFDADGQHDAGDVLRLVEPIRRGEVDVVLGSRFLGKTIDMPWTRHVMLKGAVWFTRFFSQIAVTDTHNGFRALSRQAAQTIRITQNRMAHASEILDQIREYQLRYCEAPVTIRYNVATLEKGQSNSAAVKIAAQFLLGRLVR
ncbi:glycosyltransferase family 2 protein [Blastopirellula sp. JC732]|uniref:Glycosyltransferase family 2 protein n=1 Tax=Blastopirellula sediminis TaxID=2894196 RepID=A0A9X1MRG3_9BACT|nr:glycosyltransferase family 2 protein [Blastopirellula sediminis]MCC9605319.1 glycosyltransferase family 2 protein [Blastopirellula sediminis]MCC9631381.1 glycosyltransferase family 2 protein [Blastopirellula sediminis]